MKVVRGVRDFKRHRRKRSKRKPVERPLPCSFCRHYVGHGPRSQGKGCRMGRPQTEPERLPWSERWLNNWSGVRRWFRDGRWCPDFTRWS